MEDIRSLFQYFDDVESKKLLNAANNNGFQEGKKIKSLRKTAGFYGGKKEFSN